ncbi:MAG: SpoIIE family protein phosphatase [candidate division Zixibacteria bacterium]|nr:SpoIIE family protein phosphatase [candidate division Zixibacteria bacterium]
MLNKSAKIFVLLCGVIILIDFITFSITETTGLIGSKSSGDMYSGSKMTPDSLTVFTRIDTTDFVRKPYPNIGNHIVTVDDSAYTRERWLNKIQYKSKPDQEIPIVYVDNEDTLLTTIRLHPVKASDFLQTLVLAILRFLILLAYIIVGIWAFAMRPDSGAVRALSLFCFGMSNFLTTAVGLGLEGYSSVTIPFQSQIADTAGLITAMMGGFWINLQLLFPRPRKFITNHPLWAYFICYGLLSLLLLATTITENATLNLIVAFTLLFQILAGFFILGRYYWTTNNLLEKRQTRLVLWGTGVGISYFVLLIIIAFAIRQWFLGLPSTILTGIIIGLFLSLLLSPLSFAYAFGKYRLLEVEGKIKRGTRFVIVKFGLFIVLYLIIYTIAGFLQNNLLIENQAANLFIVLALVAGVIPASRRIQGVVEKKIYPERNRLKSMLNDFLKNALAVPNKETFWKELEEHLKDVLKVDLIYPVVKNEKNESYIHWSGESTPFNSQSSLIHKLMDFENKHIMVDELTASEKIDLSEDETNWFEDKQIAMVLPMIRGDKLVGFLAIGYKSRQKDFEVADMEILHSLVSQVTVASENIMLLEENVQKRRLEDQLDMARKVQQGLLPGKIPDTPGLEIIGESLSCLEVAGDYYDVVCLDEYRTVMAIGDVSGKGAGAALLMSNLQASFRTAVSIGMKVTDIAKQMINTLQSTAEQHVGESSGITMSEMVARINELTFSNTPADRFITFFVAIYDKRTSMLEYVNAGHNPPMVIRYAGKVEELSEGGLLLGALSGMPYEQGTIKLELGDILFLYTDGISEAENAEDEMFGEEKMKELFLKNNSQTPQRLKELLEDEVKDFIGETPLSDDFTLLIAKVVE